MSLNLYQRRKLDPMVNNDYYDDEGKTVYMVHTPTILHRTTTISKALYDLPIDSVPPQPCPSSILSPEEPGYDSGIQRVGSASVGEDLEEEANTSPPISRRGSRGSRSSGEHTNFIYLAQIDWGLLAFKSSKIRFGAGQYSGREMKVKDLFRSEGRPVSSSDEL